MQTIRCPTCNGAGRRGDRPGFYAVLSWICDVCLGSGVIPAPEEKSERD